MTPRHPPSGAGRALRHLLVVTLLAVVALAAAPSVAQTCGVGRIVNPLTDVCWRCIFPISLGPARIGLPFEDIGPTPPLVCGCPAPPPVFVRPGFGLGFWSPDRMAEVVRTPYCSPTLGGISLAPIAAPPGTARAHGEQDTRDGFYHVHWFVYPLFAWMNLLQQVTCLKPETFDLAYLTELDPLWMNDELAFLINPEAILFTNPIAQAACAADCAAATAHFPLNSLFWCAGCNGSMYPLGGSVRPHVGGIESSLLASQRMLAKLHRQILARDTSSAASMCLDLPRPIIKKNQYKTQMVMPIPDPFWAHPLGRTSSIYSPGREFPVQGEDWAWLIWRKHLCCAL